MNTVDIVLILSGVIAALAFSIMIGIESGAGEGCFAFFACLISCAVLVPWWIYRIERWIYMSNYRPFVVVLPFFALLIFAVLVGKQRLFPSIHSRRGIVTCCIILMCGLLLLPLAFPPFIVSEETSLDNPASTIDNSALSAPSPSPSSYTGHRASGGDGNKSVRNIPTSEPTPEPTPKGPYCGVWITVSDYMEYNHTVGSEWTKTYSASFDGVNYVSVKPNGTWYSVDHPVTLYLRVEYVEDDTYPDVGINDYSIDLDIDPDTHSSGSYWTVEQWTEIAENNGAYAGNTCQWNTSWKIVFLHSK